jgi:hypothetical protein
MPNLTVIDAYTKCEKYNEIPFMFDYDGTCCLLDDPDDTHSAKISIPTEAYDEKYVLAISCLYRCIGLAFIYSPHKASANQTTYLQGFHVRPSAFQYSKKYLADLRKLQHSHCVSEVILAGGKINNPANMFHYRNSTNLFFQKLHHHPHTKNAKFTIFMPHQGTMETCLTIAGKKIIVAQELTDGTFQYAKMKLDQK